MNKLKSLYTEIEKLSDEIPAQLSKKISLNSQVLQWLGKYHADAILVYGKAYAERKRAWGEALVVHTGTGKEKEGSAEIESFKYRKAEAEADAEVWRWRNAFTAQQEIINALKIELKTLIKEYDNS